MASTWFICQILCVICCIAVVASYNIDDRQLFDDRNERAVTEWRFRRNYLFHFPYFNRNRARSSHYPNNNENQLDEINLKQKKLVIPQLSYRRQ